MVVSELLSRLDALAASTQQLLALARAEQWDEVVDAIQVQTAATEAFAHVNPPAAQLPAMVAAELAARLSAVREAHEEAYSRIDAWRDELGRILQDIDGAKQKSNRLLRAYGG